ncbi:MAG: choice-of-anchor L domain-containing protein [Acidimicrobiales bacterium]
MSTMKAGALALGIGTLVLAFPGTTHAAPAGSNSAESVDTAGSAQAVAQALVGPGVAISNVQYTGEQGARGTFAFNDPNVLGMANGIVMSSGNANEVVGPNTSDSNSTDWGGAGDQQLSDLSGYPTQDAAVLAFDFVPTTNQVAFQYSFASDEYPEWVNTQFNDVFAFWVTDGSGNATNCAQVRQVAGDPTSPFVPVAVNNINQSNPVQSPMPTAMRPDLFRPNYYDPAGPSPIALEMDGITKVLTCQALVTPGVANHMRLAIADSSDGVYDSAVFLKGTSLVSNDNPTAGIGLDPSAGVAPLDVSASVEGHDPNGTALSYSIDWGDGSTTGPAALPGDTALPTHTYQYAGSYAAVLTVSNGTNIGKSCDEATVSGGANPGGPVNQSCDLSAGGGGSTGGGGSSGSSLTVATLTLPDGLLNHKYKQSLYAIGGNLPYKWALAAGSAALPAGLKISGAGVISGKPTASGLWTFVVSVTDKKTKAKPHTQNSATQVVSIKVL